MESENLLKIVYDTVIVLNGIAVLLWIFLDIFPGISEFYEGNILEGFRIIFLETWFYCFVITLGIGILLYFLLQGKKESNKT